MIQQEPGNATSPRLAHLAKKLRNKKYRDSYMASHIKTFLANQIDSMRGSRSQKEYGELLGKPQPVVSRLQNPNYGKYSLQTLLDVASKLDVALIVRFVDYPTFLIFTEDFSDEAVRPAAFEPGQIDRLARAQELSTSMPAASQAQSATVGELLPVGQYGTTLQQTFSPPTAPMRGPDSALPAAIIYAITGGQYHA